MPVNKHADIRYDTLDRLLQRDSVENTCEMLRQACSDAILEHDPNYPFAEVSVRTFRDDIKYLSEKAKRAEVDIEIKKGESHGEIHYYYKYSRPGFSIHQNELSSEEVGQLSGAMKLLAKFQGLPEYDKISELVEKLRSKYQVDITGETCIEYEHIDTVGEESLSDVLNCIINKKPIQLTYRPYGREEKEWLIHPYFLKEYRNRWFLLGYNETEGRYSTLALDRISPDFEPSNQPFIPNTSVNYRTFFDNVIGVTVKDAPVEHIVFQATKERFPYIESKPLHSSFETIDAEEGVFSIDVIPNRELDALVLSYMGDIKVISPDSYREHIFAIIKRSYELFSRCED